VPDVAWECVGRTTDYPGFGPRQGQNAVKDFFAFNDQNLAFTEFSPKEFYAVDDKVFVLGRYALTMKKNGRKHESDWVHVFTVRDGKVVEFREFSDTAQAAEAFRD
jgi:uncharacterized protein